MINGQMCRGKLLEESAGNEITFPVASGQGKPQGMGSRTWTLQNWKVRGEGEIV